MESLIVVGAGVFGLSTAIAAAASSYRVTLIDDGDPAAASRGLGRIFRTKYPRDEYEELARSAGPFWEDRSTFHRVLRRVFDDGEVFDDFDAGWIEAEEEMAQLLEQTKTKVAFIASTVVGLTWNGERCTGITLDSGQSLTGDTILLAIGGRLPDFLRAEGRDIDDFCCPVIVPWLSIRLTDQNFEKMKNSPIVIHPGKGKRCNAIWSKWLCSSE
jgi:glycine/D-amino acid oxidase-like deaminating enzyme